MEAESQRFCPICGVSVGAARCPEHGVRTVPEALLDGGTDELPGRVFAERYRVEELLGAGGMGRVYRATQLSMDRSVALKTLHPTLLPERRQVQRFYREAQAASRLEGPHVVRVYDFGIDGETGIPFMALELLRGRSLSELLQGGPVEPVRAAELLAQVAGALVEAHEQGIVHRDLKPDNVFLTQTPGKPDFVRVMDFGIAKVVDATPSGTPTLTGTGMTMGTPLYMAPEQCLAREIDGRADLYAIGCMLHELLTGWPPFAVEEPMQIMMLQVAGPIPYLPDPLPTGHPVPASLAVLHGALLSKAAGDRPGSAEVVRQILSAFAAGEAVDAGALIEASRYDGPPAPSLEGLRPGSTQAFVDPREVGDGTDPDDDAARFTPTPPGLGAARFTPTPPGLDATGERMVMEHLGTAPTASVPTPRSADAWEAAERGMPPETLLGRPPRRSPGSSDEGRSPDPSPAPDTELGPIAAPDRPTVPPDPAPPPGSRTPVRVVWGLAAALGIAVDVAAIAAPDDSAPRTSPSPPARDARPAAPADEASAPRGVAVATESPAPREIRRLEAADRRVARALAPPPRIPVIPVSARLAEDAARLERRDTADPPVRRPTKRRPPRSEEEPTPW